MVTSDTLQPNMLEISLDNFPPVEPGNNIMFLYRPADLVDKEDDDDDAESVLSIYDDLCISTGMHDAVAHRNNVGVKNRCIQKYNDSKK